MNITTTQLDSKTANVINQLVDYINRLENTIIDSKIKAYISTSASFQEDSHAKIASQKVVNDAIDNVNTSINQNNLIMDSKKINKTDLSNVTNDNQVKAITSSTNGDIITWSGTTGDTPADSGKSFTTDGTLAANSDLLIPTEQAVKTYHDVNNTLMRNTGNFLYNRLTVNYTLSANCNSTSPFTILSGVYVSIPAGITWTVNLSTEIIDQFYMPIPILLLRMESDYEIDNPPIGVAPTRSAGFNYIPSILGNNAWQSNSNYHQYLNLNIREKLFLSPSTIEFWFKRTDVSSVVYNFIFFETVFNGGDSSHFSIRFQSTTNNLTTSGTSIYLLYGGGTKYYLWSWTDLYTNLFPLNTWVHIGIIIDSSQADASKLKLYKNNSEYTTGKAFASSGTPDTLDTIFYDNFTLSSHGGNVGNADGAFGAFDNFKIFNYLKTEFSDRYCDIVKIKRR